LKFFLQAAHESAQDAAITIDRLAALHDKNVSVISGMGRTAKNALQLLCDAGILVQFSGKQRNRVFSYEAYLILLREGT